MTCSVSSSPGESIKGEPSRTVNSACCTTTGAVAVRPPPPDAVAWIVPCPGERATTLPLWSTLATSGRSDVHVTITGVAGGPASPSARGETREVSDGGREKTPRSRRRTAAGPPPGGWPPQGAGPAGGG